MVIATRLLGRERLPCIPEAERRDDKPAVGLLQDCPSSIPELPPTPTRTGPRLLSCIAYRRTPNFLHFLLSEIPANAIFLLFVYFQTSKSIMLGSPPCSQRRSVSLPTPCVR